jgi:hypothetical protein
VNGVDPLGLAAGHLSPDAACQRFRDKSTCEAEIQSELGGVPCSDQTLASQSGPEALLVGLTVLTGGLGDILDLFATGAESSTYIDVTLGGSIRNIATSVTETEFADTLDANGWTSSISKDGAVQIFEKDGAKYVLREYAGSYSGWSADFTPSGSSDVTLKLRLGYPK